MGPSSDVAVSVTIEFVKGFPDLGFQSRRGAVANIVKDLLSDFDVWIIGELEKPLPSGVVVEPDSAWAELLDRFEPDVWVFVMG